VRLSGEIDFAKERYKTMQEDQKIEKQQIMERKLLRKGSAMSDKKSKT